MSVITEPKVSSSFVGWCAAALAAVDVFFVWTYVLWSNADTWAINRAEQAGADGTLLLPNSHLLWVTINITAIALVAVNILLIRAWVVSRRVSLKAA